MRRFSSKIPLSLGVSWLTFFSVQAQSERQDFDTAGHFPTARLNSAVTKISQQVSDLQQMTQAGYYSRLLAPKKPIAVLAGSRQAVDACDSYLCAALSADLTATLLLDDLNFSAAQVGVPRDFIVTLSEVNNLSGKGTVGFKIAKLTAFTISYSPSSSRSNVLGGLANTNPQWSFSEDANYITVQSNASFPAFGSQIIGFSISRQAGIPTNTVQSINITVLPNAGGELNFGNNVAVTSVTAN